MELQQIKRGRLIDHIQLVVADLTASRRFYEAVLGTLGVSMEGEADGFCWADELVLSSADSPASQGKLTGRVHLAFQAKDRRQVDAFYQAGIAAGARDNGAPGERANYHPGYYAAFLLYPDGNNIEIVIHGESHRSSDAVTIVFQNPAGEKGEEAMAERTEPRSKNGLTMRSRAGGRRGAMAPLLSKSKSTVRFVLVATLTFLLARVPTLADDLAHEAGRHYTQAFLAGRLDGVWTRMTPRMRDAFGTIEAGRRAGAR